jgi:hypothetical protein
MAMGLALAGLLVGASLARAGEAELLRLLDRAEQQLAGVRDYTMTMFSRERVGEALQPEERVFVKFQRPFRVYMRWQEGPSKGRESIYVAGANNGKMLLYEPKGIQRLFTAAMEPTDKRVLEVSRHPITDMGIGRLLEMVGDNTRRAARNGVLRVVDRGQTEVAGRQARQIEGILPQDPKAGYYAYRVVLSFDQENHLPIRVVVHDWQDRLVEDYIYADLQLNPGLNGRDFDPANIDYGFSSWRIPFSK